MTLMINRKTHTQRSTALNTDEVIGYAAIPAGGAFMGATLQGSAMGAESSSTLGAMIYGLSGYVVPITDPDTLDDPDDVWDLMVPKDLAILEDNVDFDFLTTPSVTPDLTPGEFHIGDIISAGQGPVKLFRTERVVTFASSPTGFIAGTPDAYFPTDLFSIRVKQKVRVTTPSVVLFALSSPTPGVPSVFTGNISQWAPGGNDEWYNLRFLGDAIERGSIWSTRTLTEDEPFESIMELVGRQLEQVFEETTGAYVAHTINSFTECHYQIEVPGHLRVKSVSSGGG